MKDLRERAEEMLRFMPLRHESRVKWLMRCLEAEAALTKSGPGLTPPTFDDAVFGEGQDQPR